MIMMKCPNCGHHAMIVTEDFDITHTDPSHLVLDVAGCCPVCNKKYIWEQHYELIKECNPEPDDWE